MLDGNRTSDRWRVRPGQPLDLASVDTGTTEGAPGGKRDTESAVGDLREELAELQARLWAERQRSVLAVLQAIDTGGKDGTIRHVLRGTNPAGVKVHAFGRPTEEELAHDFLWRIHARTPAKGEITVFNRSHYEDVLVVRVNRLVDEAVWRPRYEQITAFEETLTVAGTQVVKFFLHISKEEQARRLQRRLDLPDKRWKFEAGDLKERARWDDYQTAFAEALARTSTEAAPWYVIPGDKKWYRNWAVATTLVELLRDMNPQYPAPAVGLDEMVVR